MSNLNDFLPSETKRVFDNGGVAVSGDVTLDCRNYNYFILKLNGTTNIKGSSWRSGQRYHVILTNTSGGTTSYNFKSDDGNTNIYGPHNIGTDHLRHLKLWSGGTTDAKLLYDFQSYDPVPSTWS
jgi:hypothetical protein